jgi:hypothetical protein
MSSALVQTKGLGDWRLRAAWPRNDFRLKYFRSLLHRRILPSFDRLTALIHAWVDQAELAA